MWGVCQNLAELLCEMSEVRRRMQQRSLTALQASGWAVGGLSVARVSKVPSRRGAPSKLKVRLATRRPRDAVCATRCAARLSLLAVPVHVCMCTCACACACVHMYMYMYMYMYMLSCACCTCMRACVTLHGP